MDHKKKKLRDKFLELLKERMQDEGASNKELAVLSDKFDKVLVSFKDAIANQIITKIPPEVAISNLQVEIGKILNSQSKTSEVLHKAIGDLYIKMSESVSMQKRALAWYDDPSVKVKGAVLIKSDGPLKVEKDDSTIIAALAALFASLMSGLKQLAARTVKIMPIAEAYTTPQFVIIVDPANGRPVRPNEIGKAPVAGGGMTAIAASGGSSHVGSRGADEFNDGAQTVVTAGTAVQLAGDTNCYRVTIQAHPNNSGDIVIGGPAVVAATAGRRGLSLFNNQWETFKVSNLNQIYLDSTQDGDKVNYFYER